ncbi:MAG TPA: hypothetical protein VFJ16_18805 [Longimicrobium sp.]|nr:hypothetical protein [Longimicrobium sp.]
MIATLKARLQTEICPYCFEAFKLRDTPFRCASPPGRCTPEPDEVRAKAWEDRVPMGRVMGADGRFREHTRCSACSQVTHKRLCPHCHMELPHTVGKFPHFIFAVVGAKEAGKSHYLAVLIDQVRRELGPSLEMLLEPLNDHTIKRYRDDFHRPLFQERKVITSTVSALTDRRVQMPLVYTLTFSGRDLLGRKRIRSVVTLVFFDTAGEDLDDEDTIAMVNKYIYHSHGIILLLDPLQLPRVRADLEGRVALPRVNTETADILTRMTRLVLAGRKLPANAMISAPLAVAFSKFDAVEALVDPQLQLNAAADHRTGFDVADFDAVNAEMQALLARWDSQVLVHQVRTHYRRFGFFGLSALGCNPHGDQQVPRVLPRRVEDPFLWLLHEHRLIPTRKRG